jgi:2,3-bisphosphoglycerate-independent phosphoglycerate mutase
MAEAIRAAYRTGEEDEMLRPRVLVDERGTHLGRIGKGDPVIFYNIRGEREIELSRALTEPDFGEFPVPEPLEVSLATMIEYDPSLRARVAFPPLGEVRDTLSEVVSRAGLKQAKVCESEKAVHVSFFLNGKRQAPYPGEERVIVESDRTVANFDEKPEMSAKEVARAFCRRLEDDACALVVGNLANVDVVGHIENREAVLRAVETVDTQVGVCARAASNAGVPLLLTADHGTVEKWLYPDGQVDTGHTDSPVPLLLLPPPGSGSVSLRDGGALTDVAPTVLDILGLPVPDSMTGQSLLSGGFSGTKGRAALLILDGWGHRSETEGNLIHASNTREMDRLFGECPSTMLRASGEAVGMPGGTVGNSEVGHLHLGSGRVIPSDRVRIARAIEDGSFFENEAFVSAMEEARTRKRPLHLMGIVSFYSSHGSVDHLYALLEMAARSGVPGVFVHAMLGRRGERPGSGAAYIEDVERRCGELGLGRVVTVIGRYWSLDREFNWDRIERTYRAFVLGEGIEVSETS